MTPNDGEDYYDRDDYDDRDDEFADDDLCPQCPSIPCKSPWEFPREVAGLPTSGLKLPRSAPCWGAA